MKKQCVIFFNCHGGELQHHLLSSKQFNNNYDIHYIALYDYIEGYKYGGKNDLIDEHKHLIQNCDMIILQYIKKDRKIIHQDYIKSLLKPDCTSIIIPHYSFSGYQYPHDIINDDNINEHKTKEELNNYINNLFIDKKKEILLHLESELNHIKELDVYSDISCYQFVKDNYNKTLLFYSRSYPTYVLFHFISQEILKKISITDVIKPVWSSYAQHCTDIIYPNVKKYLNLEFNIKFNYKCNILEYIICCKKCNTNSFLLLKETKIGRIHSKCIKELILAKTYR
tara:strand:+ start:67 stop:915 length:849 start_codon:yes stop_codon:yes gene_type:complete